MSRTKVTTLCSVIAAFTTVACATRPDPPLHPPSYAVIITRPEPKAALYADCIAAAAATKDYAHGQDGDSSLVLFTCRGAPARAFYDGLAERSAAIGSEVMTNGRTLRSTNRVGRNLFGVDYCSTDGEGDYSCVISLNAGDFLRESPD